MILTENPDGLNVTIPYKEKIIPYLHEIDPIAQQVGAVNCITIRKGRLKGYNTDVIGFEESLLKHLSLRHKKALIFGAGGASLAVRYVLQKHHVPFLHVSRNEINEGITYGDLTEALFNDYTILINTTPVGMYPDVNDLLPIPYGFVSDKHFAFDMIYNPEKTKFLTFCEKEGAQILNGYEMLIIQAEASYSIFTNS